MLIESITLKNFRQYKGENTILFSTDPKKNVTIITGENTCGKTTLVQSFIWCLYGKIDFKDKKVLNADEREILLEGTVGAINDASVIVRLEHNDKKYIIERKETNRVVEGKKINVEQSFKIYVIDDVSGNALPIEKNEYGSIIVDILPENLSDYFFFWGERIEKLSERKELSGAVKQFLGLDTMDSAIRHLNTVVNKLTKDVGVGSNDSDIERVKNRIAELERSNDDLEIQLNNLQKNIEYYNQKANGLYEELTTSENKELQSKQNDYRNKSELLKNKRSELEKTKITFSKHFNDSNNYVYFYANEAEKKAAKLLRSNPEPVVGWNYIDMNAINEILKRGKCVCGNEFCKDDNTYKYLIEQKKLVAPNVIGGAINSFVEEVERREPFNQNYCDLVHDDYKRISKLEDEILDLEYEVEMLHKNIMGKSDMKEKSKKYQEAIDEINKSNKRLGELNAQRDRNNEDIERFRKNIIIYMEKNKKYEKKVKTIKCAQNVLDIFKEDYAQNEQSLKMKLEKYVNENFEEVYSGKRIIKIDEKYNAIALNKVGDKWMCSETSPGLETVKNFAFISGLVKCAKEKIIGGDGNETEANKDSYPLVLDAPFSQTDEKHVPAISKLISKNAEQIILVVMKKDWNYAKDVLSSKVGRSYNLEKVTETQTIVKEGE